MVGDKICDDCNECYSYSKEVCPKCGSKEFEIDFEDFDVDLAEPDGN